MSSVETTRLDEDDMLLPAHESTHGTRWPGTASGACKVPPRSPWPAAFPPGPPLAICRLCSDPSLVLCCRATPPPRTRWSYSSSPSPAGPPLLPRARRGSPGSRALSFRTCSKALTARDPWGARLYRSPRCCLPLHETGSAPRSVDFAAQCSACPCPCPTLRHGLAVRRRMTRGQGGWLFLPCTTLSFATQCRFIPALSPRSSASHFHPCASIVDGLI